ncbi:hypothetical protein L6164_014346 [Bauhinia variegata]|uniref:Uncharacterized protein n=1 Tax=Bauhinia variegata TaxID=167791 RepID=A0ACB9NHY1_BAUVA|nr:hypothetical protein L6164_014346 [Bauhinia variegata]
MGSTPLSVYGFVPSQKSEESGSVTDFKTSFCGQVVCNPSFFSRQTINSPGNRLVVTSLTKTRQVRETVIPDPDYRIPIVLLGVAGGLADTDNLVPAIKLVSLDCFCCSRPLDCCSIASISLKQYKNFEVKIGEQLRESGENVFTGGSKYSTFVNWELWWPNFPILVYFKEAQTKPEGQIHFFPVIFNGKQLYDVMVERAGPSQNSGPKVS